MSEDIPTKRRILSSCQQAIDFSKQYKSHSTVKEETDKLHKECPRELFMQNLSFSYIVICSCPCHKSKEV